MYRLRGQLLPLVYLRRELKMDGAGANEKREQEAINIVVLQADGRQFGLMVDKINDTQEIVVKPLGKQLKIKTFAGASIMGDGKMALILDVMGLAQRANVVNEARDRESAEMFFGAATAEKDKQTSLLYWARQCSYGSAA